MARRPSPGRPGRPDWSQYSETADPYQLLKGVYKIGRAGGSDRDYTRPEEEPQRQAPVPTWDDYRASLRPARDSKVSNPLDESQPQFRDEQAAHLNDTPNNWTRGYAQSPHPFFERNHRSGYSFDKNRKG